MTTDAQAHIERFARDVDDSGSGEDTPSPTTTAPTLAPRFNYKLSAVPCSQIAAIDILTVQQCNLAANSVADVPNGLMAIENNGRSRFRKPYGCYFSKKKSSLQLNIHGKEKNTNANQPVLCISP
jgi:hypothetical protein